MDVVAVVLLGQPRGRELRHAIVVMAGDQQRRRIQGVPARRPVVRHDLGDHLACLRPEREEVIRLAGQLCDLLAGPLRGTRWHPPMVDAAALDTQISGMFTPTGATVTSTNTRGPPRKSRRGAGDDLCERRLGAGPADAGRFESRSTRRGRTETRCRT